MTTAPSICARARSGLAMNPASTAAVALGTSTVPSARTSTSTTIATYDEERVVDGDAAPAAARQRSAPAALLHGQAHHALRSRGVVRIVREARAVIVLRRIDQAEGQQVLAAVGPDRDRGGTRPGPCPPPVPARRRTSRWRTRGEWRSRCGTSRCACARPPGTPRRACSARRHGTSLAPLTRSSGVGPVTPGANVALIAG